MTPGSSRSNVKIAALHGDRLHPTPILRQGLIPDVAHPLPCIQRAQVKAPLADDIQAYRPVAKAGTERPAGARAIAGT
jgi:hypothetical protein